MTGYTTEGPTPPLRMPEAITDTGGPTMGRVTFEADVVEEESVPCVVSFGRAGMIGTARGQAIVTVGLVPVDHRWPSLRGKRIRIEVIDE